MQHKFNVKLPTDRFTVRDSLTLRDKFTLRDSLTLRDKFTLKSLVGFQCLFLNYKDSCLPKDLKDYLNDMWQKRYNELCKVCHNQRIKVMPVPRLYPRVPDKIKFATIADKYGIIIINTLSVIVKDLNKKLLMKKITNIDTEFGLVCIDGYIHRFERGSIPFISLQDQNIYKNNPYIDPLNITTSSDLLPYKYMKNPYI